MKVDDKLTIEAEPDASLRETEYVLVSYNREGKEVEGLIIHVDNEGKIRRIAGPMSLLAGVDIIAGAWNNREEAN